MYLYIPSCICCWGCCHNWIWRWCCSETGVLVCLLSWCFSSFQVEHLEVSVLPEETWTLHNAKTYFARAAKIGTWHQRTTYGLDITEFLGSWQWLVCGACWSATSNHCSWDVQHFSVRAIKFPLTWWSFVINRYLTQCFATIQVRVICVANHSGIRYYEPCYLLFSNIGKIYFLENLTN